MTSDQQHRARISVGRRKDGAIIMPEYLEVDAQLRDEVQQLRSEVARLSERVSAREDVRPRSH